MSSICTFSYDQSKYVKAIEGLSGLLKCAVGSPGVDHAARPSSPISGTQFVSSSLPLRKNEINTKNGLAISAKSIEANTKSAHKRLNKVRMFMANTFRKMSLRVQYFTASINAVGNCMAERRQVHGR